MDTLLGLVLFALAIAGAVWIARAIRARFASHPAREGVPAAELPPVLEEARTFALGLGYEEITPDRLERNSRFRQHAERLSKPDIPFEELSRLARSDTPAIAALGLSAIARRGVVPDGWPTTAV